MAVYDRSYHRWKGKETARWKRFLVITRYTMQEVMEGRFVFNFYVFSLLLPLAPLVLIYANSQQHLLRLIGLPEMNLITINEAFFYKWMTYQAFCGLCLVFLTIPNLFVNDYSQNALILYLTRPISRWDYILGKALVPLFMLSTVVWVPIELLIVFHSTLTSGFLSTHIDFVFAVFVSGCLYMIMFTLLSFAIVILAKTKQKSRMFLFLFYIISRNIDFLIDRIFDSPVGKYGDIVSVYTSLWRSLMSLEEGNLLGNSIVFVFVCCVSLYIFQRRIRPFQHVRA